MEFVKSMKLATLLAASTFVLAACGGGGTTDTTTDTTADTTAETTDTTAETTDTTAETTDTAADTSGGEAAAGDLQDGTYRLEEQNLDEHGWRVEFEITVADGEITESNYGEYNEEGMPKTEDEEYQEAMSGQVDIGPQDYIPELNQQLEQAGDPSEVEAITGATSSSQKFMDYAEQLVSAAQEGNTETIEVDN